MSNVVLWEHVEVGVSKTGLAIRFNQLSYKCKLNVYSMVFDHDNLSGTAIFKVRCVWTLHLCISKMLVTVEI